MTDIAKIQNEVTAQIANKEIMDTLIKTTFKGLAPLVVKSAIVEGMMRGFTFKDFLEKNVYAIPFGGGYSLVTSIDYARKVGMKSGVCGKSAPSFTMNADKIESCTVTIKRLFGDTVGEYTATVFFDEYNTGKQQWASKPRTMIAKVAEMHALRMACPEEMSQIYTEDEMHDSTVIQIEEIPEEIEKKVNEAKTLDELKIVWKEHKGLGKEFGKMVVAKKKELTPPQNVTDTPSSAK
jgi:hypothetical protein